MKKFHWLAEGLWEIIKIQFICYLYMLRGGILLGIFPAIAAVYALIRQYLIHGSYQSIHSSMKKYFKENFKTANILGWVLTIFTILTYWNWYLIPQLTHDVIKMSLYGVLVIFGLLIIIVWIYFLPIIVHFKWDTFACLHASIAIGFHHLSHTVLQFLLVILIYFLSFQIIQLSIFGLFPILAFVQMYICQHIFKLSINEKKDEKQLT